MNYKDVDTLIIRAIRSRGCNGTFVNIKTFVEERLHYRSVAKTKDEFIRVLDRRLQALKTADKIRFNRNENHWELK